jgi:hypothetical protein
MGKDMAEVMMPFGMRLITLEEGIVTGTELNPMPADDMLFQILVSMAQLSAEQRRGQTKQGMGTLYDTGFEKGVWFNLYPDSTYDSVYREVANRYPDVVSYQEGQGGMSPTALGMLIHNNAGVFPTGKKKGKQLIGASWAGKNKNKYKEAPMRRIMVATEKGVLDDWLNLIDRLLAYEREYSIKDKRVKMLRYQTNGALNFNPNSHPLSMYTDEILAHMFDNLKTYQSAKSKKKN